MRIAWFRAAAPDLANLLDDSASLIHEFSRSRQIDVIVERQAHDFVWQQSLNPWDLCVYELDQSAAHSFVWGYLVNYAGVVMLRSANVAHLQVALAASRAIVAPTSEMAAMLRSICPAAQVRTAPPAIASPGEATAHAPTGRASTIAVYDVRPHDRTLVDRALQRARDAGATFAQIRLGADCALPANCDVVVSPEWPPFGQMPTATLAGMAAGKAIVTTETEVTGGWPALDPQTWRPRDLAATDAPIAVTIDPRDEEHSLVLAIRRLSSDATLRTSLGEAAHNWWMHHATPAHAAAAWERILDEARQLSARPRPTDWPAAFVRNGSELTREILDEIGVREIGRER
jgi:hypothetical protein